MGFLVLMIVGGILGWLASIIIDMTNKRSIAINIGAGVLGSVIIGNAVNGSLAFGSLTATAFLLGCIGALALIAIANLIGDRLPD